MEHYKQTEADNAYNETFLPITTSYYLFLSGTPFRAINSGEFIEDQIFNWTYSDEQNAKENWGKQQKSNDWEISENEPNYGNKENPYASLARMVLMTYKIPDEITSIAQGGEFDEFDLNEFLLQVEKVMNQLLNMKNMFKNGLI